MNKPKPSKHDILPEETRLANAMEARCQSVVNQEQCKHGMKFEYCGLCQKVEFIKEVKFPIDGKDRVTGEPTGKKVWLRTDAKQVRYMRYR